MAKNSTLNTHCSVLTTQYSLLLIFDIGKTNKKFFLFDPSFNILHTETQQFDEITDEDGFPCEDIQVLANWVKQKLHYVLTNWNEQAIAVNFSAYGASFVHVDEKGCALTPLYNYLKSYPEDLLEDFHHKYGSPELIAKETASPPLQMLNSGLQLYRIKHTKPDVYKKIKWSLHLPQYLSFMISGIPVSDYTSIGCHTGLWDYVKNDYHSWVKAEGIDLKLAPIVEGNHLTSTMLHGKTNLVGPGIHDSSASLIPCLISEIQPFILLSTGTWSIALNPFNHEPLSWEELQEDCLSYMRSDGKSVKASRLFLGNEFAFQVHILRKFYQKPESFEKSVSFDPKIYNKLIVSPKSCFCFESIPNLHPAEQTMLSGFESFEEAYHQLILELTEVQLRSIDIISNTTAIKKIFIDGGFANNELFINMLADRLKEVKIEKVDHPNGAALGAAMVISENLKDMFEN